jgi:hypothetical protein
LPRRNNFTVQAPNHGTLGVSMGDFAMTDREWNVRKDQLERYRVLEEETTDPLATALLHEIVLELEAELKNWLRCRPLSERSQGRVF